MRVIARYIIDDTAFCKQSAVAMNEWSDVILHMESQKITILQHFYKENAITIIKTIWWFLAISSKASLIFKDPASMRAWQLCKCDLCIHHLINIAGSKVVYCICLWQNSIYRKCAHIYALFAGSLVASFGYWQ